MVGGSGFQPRFTGAIAVKNRSHKPKVQLIPDYKISLSFRLDARGERPACMKLQGMTIDEW
jgi:hypothetical protein